MQIKLTDGRTAEITATLITDEVIDANLDIHRAVCDIKWSVSINGVGQSWGGEGPVEIDHRTINGKQIVGKIGKLALTAEQYAEVLAMCDAIKASEYWTAWRAKIAANQDGVAAYERHHQAVNNMMTLNGRSY